MIALIMFFVGLVLSIITGLLGELFGSFALIFPLIFGVVIGVLMWNYAEYALFPLIGFLLVVLLMNFVFFNVLLSPITASISVSISIYSASATLTPVVKYLLGVENSSRRHY